MKLPIFLLTVLLSISLSIPSFAQQGDTIWGDTVWVDDDAQFEEGYGDDNSDSESGMMYVLIGLGLALAGGMMYWFSTKNKKQQIAVSTGTSQAPAPTPELRTPSNFDVNEIKLLISNDKADEAVNKLINILKEKSSDVFNDILLCNSQLKELKRKSRIGAISREQEVLERNKINAALLDILDDLKK